MNNWPVGIKKTRQRESVLAVLESTETPISATDISSKIKEGGDSAWLSTIYRILELFVQKGVVAKLAVMDNEMAVYVLNRLRHKHYAVCMACHKIIPMDNCPMEKFTPKLEEKDFHVMGHNLEVFGYCKDCSSK